MLQHLCTNDVLEATISNLLVMATDIRNEITTTLGVDIKSSETDGFEEGGRARRLVLPVDKRLDLEAGHAYTS